jgi:hypothetical protein
MQQTNLSSRGQVTPCQPRGARAVILSVREEFWLASVSIKGSRSQLVMW